MKMGFLKKVINFVFFGIFLCFCGLLTVDASSAALSLDCNFKEVVVLKSITCDVNISTDAIVNNVSFVLESDGFNLSFKEENGFVNNGTISNEISLHKDNMTSGKIGVLEIMAPGSISEGEKKVALKNIVITNTLDTTIVFNNSDINETINVLSNKSNNNKLKQLTIDEKIIDGFISSKNEYSVTVNTNKIVIGAISDHDKAQVDGAGEKALAVGDNSFEIKVTAENGDVNTYNINVKYEIPKSSDNTLKSLELYFEDEKIDFTYDITKTEFDINVEANVNKLEIMSTLNDEKASYVKKYENREVKLDYGKNKVEIRVIAEDDQVRSYILNIIREDDRNSNKTLSSLVINGEKVSLSSSIFEYRVDVRYKYNQSDIKAIPTDEKAFVDFDNIALVDGENGPVIITVTAENGEKQEYKIIINRLSEAESKVTLEKITIDGYDFPFDINVRIYDLTLKNDDKSLKINVIPSENIDYVILNNENLGDGSTVIIRVTDDDGERTYNLNIHKDLDKILGIPVDLICYMVFGIGVVSMIASIVYVVKVNKKDN